MTNPKRHIIESTKCGDCGRVFPGTDPYWVEQAENCGKCMKCGVEIRHNYSPPRCSACETTDRKEHTEALLAKATEISATESFYCFLDHDLYPELVPYDGIYTDDPDGALEDAKENALYDLPEGTELTLPEEIWAFGVEEDKPRLNLDSILENMLEEYICEGESWTDRVSKEDFGELEKYFSAWLENQAVTALRPDYTKKIRIK